MKVRGVIKEAPARFSPCRHWYEKVYVKGLPLLDITIQGKCDKRLSGR